MNQNKCSPETNHLTLHGVFMDISDTGVLLRGCSGVGKSDVALELIHRGHRLIADDSVLFEPAGPTDQAIIGTCPPVLQNFLEVRGLGILNIKVMFGDTAIAASKPLQLIINMVNLSDQELHDVDRLHGMQGMQNILGIEIPEVTIPLTPGRNLAMLVEAAVKNYVLKLTGYEASVEFMQRHTTYMQQLDKESTLP